MNANMIGKKLKGMKHNTELDFCLYVKNVADLKDVMFKLHLTFACMGSGVKTHPNY